MPDQLIYYVLLLSPVLVTQLCYLNTGFSLQRPSAIHVQLLMYTRENLSYKTPYSTLLPFL